MSETDFKFRRRAIRTLTPKIGVYLLCDLDNIPIYVGQSIDGIRARVSRHLTSARSDIIANRQIDVWEIAYVHAYPVRSRAGIARLESQLYYHFDKHSPLMNGTRPKKFSGGSRKIPRPAQIVQVMSTEEIKNKLAASERLPRQAAHYAQIVGHFLAVKNSHQISRAMNAHFDRLRKYHATLLGLADDQAGDDGDA